MDSLMLKPSFYNIIIRKENGIILFNTASGKMIRCFENANTVEEILRCENIAYSNKNEFIAKLYKFGMLVNANRDEILEIKEKEESLKPGKYLQLILLPTEQCNFRCVYCYEKFERGWMTLETQDAIVRYVDDNIDCYSGLNVIWFGGEPTEAIDILERLSMQIIEICKRKKKVYNAGISTNGYNLTLEKFKRLRKLHITEYQITIDGVPFIHDSQRVLANGGKTFDVIMNNLQQIKNTVRSSTITFLIRTNFSKEMLGHIDEFCEILDEKLGGDTRIKLFWQMVGDYGYISDESARRLFGDAEDYKWLLKEYAKRMVNDYTKVFYGPDGGVCYALKRDSIVVDSSGSIRKCTCDLDCADNYFGVIGRYFDRRKHDAWLRRRNILENSRCHLCKKRPICHNRVCYKAQKCLPNYEFFSDILLQIAEDSTNYIVL